VVENLKTSELLELWDVLENKHFEPLFYGLLNSIKEVHINLLIESGDPVERGFIKGINAVLALKGEVLQELNSRQQ